MATIINNPSDRSSGEGLGEGLIVGILIAALIGLLFFIYGLPMLQREGEGSEVQTIEVQLPATTQPAPAPISTE